MKLRPLTEKERVRFMQLCTWAKLTDHERRTLCHRVAGDDCHDTQGVPSTRAPGWDSPRFVRLMAAAEAELGRRVGDGEVPLPRAWRSHGYWQKIAREAAEGAMTDRQFHQIKQLFHGLHVQLAQGTTAGAYLRGIAGRACRREFATWKEIDAPVAAKLIDALKAMARQQERKAARAAA